VDVESVHIFMRSLNESVPTDMLAVDADRKITAQVHIVIISDGMYCTWHLHLISRFAATQELRNCIRDMYITLGYDYSDRYNGSIAVFVLVVGRGGTGLGAKSRRFCTAFGS
jgi:hypothetical protein